MLRTIFMGTPEFAVASLNAMVNNGFIPVAVVSSPDKPAGRGLKMQSSAVKRAAEDLQLPILQPEKLSDENFLQEIRALRADLIVVVAFRKLPAKLISATRLGAINVHASLLPQYRGAAPINWAIINGEEESGVTTFFLDETIDTGKILYQEKIRISADMTAGMLHDGLSELGASLLVKSLKSIESGDYQVNEQNNLLREGLILKPAPKIFKEHCLINWQNSVNIITNLIRGLCPYPGAYTYLISPDGKSWQLKILKAIPELHQHNLKCGMIETDAKKEMRICGSDGYVNIREIQLAGKRIMTVDEFLRGFPLTNAFIVGDVGSQPSEIA